MYAFLAGMMAARFWRGILWTIAWMVVIIVPSMNYWGLGSAAAVVLFGFFALCVRRRQQARFAQARVAEMQLQAELNAQAIQQQQWAVQEWAQQERLAQMQLQAQMNAQALFDEHARRYGVPAPQQGDVRTG